jgi:hypothetical protein
MLICAVVRLPTAVVLGRAHLKAAQPLAVLVLVAVTLLQLFVTATIATAGWRRLYRLRRRETSGALWTSA